MPIVSQCHCRGGRQWLWNVCTDRCFAEKCCQNIFGRIFQVRFAKGRVFFRTSFHRTQGDCLKRLVANPQIGETKVQSKVTFYEEGWERDLFLENSNRVDRNYGKQRLNSVFQDLGSTLQKLPLRPLRVGGRKLSWHPHSIGPWIPWMWLLELVAAAGKVALSQRKSTKS